MKKKIKIKINGKINRIKDKTKLSDLIKKVRADEQHHSKINLKYSEK